MYVELKEVSKQFGRCEAARGVSFGVERGKLAALLGPSGSGKTTILRMIAGLEAPDAGQISIDGRVVNNLPASERGVGFVFQQYALFRYMTVFDNIAFGLSVQKKSRAEIRARVDELIELTGLQGLERRYPNQLSGGQRQRVAFARALAPNPRLLLLDEPFAAIDAKVRGELRAWLRQMVKLLSITSIFVTHDQDEALEVADELIILEDGRMMQAGSPVDIYKNPRTPFVAQFIGGSAVVEGYRQLTGFKQYALPDRAVVRPEFVEAFKRDNEKFRDVMDVAEPGVVESIAFRGGHLELKLKVKGMTLTTNRSLERRPVAVGEQMCVLVYRMYVFDEDRAYLVKNQALAGRTVGE
ncbi:sulfate/molybdate ABC transporter ATP-binding protein [Bacillota bacterium Meth-B3]